MENAHERPSGLKTRIATLLNNEVCSDVVFHVRHKEETSYYYAHSPILFVAGKGFPDLVKQTYKTKAINISDFSPLIVELMLTFIYTDELNISSLDNAVDLYKLSRMYGIDELEKLCRGYITKEVNIDSLFVKYKSALSCNFPDLLQKCRYLVQSETKAIFASRYFREAPFLVVEDIFSLDNLNISSEFEVIKAAFQWSACECRRKGRSADKFSLRNAIEPLLKHLRVLSFSADEFSHCISKFGYIFTAFETTILRRKILQPNYETQLPKNLCSISKPRQLHQKTSNHMVGRINSTDFYSGYTNNILTSPYFEEVGKNALKDLYSGSVHKIIFRDSYESANKNASKSSNSAPLHRNNFFDYCDAQKVHSNILYRNGSNNLLSKIDSSDYPPESTSENASKSSNSRPVHSNNFFDCDAQKFHSNIFNRNNRNNFLRNSSDYSPKSTNENKSSNSFLIPVNNLKSGHEDAFLFSQNLEKGPISSRVQLKSVLEYNHEKAKPVLKVMLPLQKIRKSIGFASSKDIKCNAKIQMQAGVIFIHGIELKISEQKHNPNESIEVLSCITNNNPPKYDIYSLKLKNSILSITYPEPFMVALENPLDIEITIEDLILNRCFVCLGRTFELNCGLNAKAEISVKSNQYYGQDNVLYLINRIFYSVVS